VANDVGATGSPAHAPSDAGQKAAARSSPPFLRGSPFSSIGIGRGRGRDHSVEGSVTVELRWPTWIGVVAEDLEQQRRFYRDTLGFKETGSSEGWVQLAVPGGGLFELIERDTSAQYEAKRYQVGFTVADIRAARRELVRRGVAPISEIEGEESGSPNLWCYFRDPEGNVFEITEWLAEERS
jgi:catechol 2,3-dioxygenase-like lactoylglutathione lyase family enzyme